MPRERVAQRYIKISVYLLFTSNSHVEVNVEWLEPLLTRISENPKTVAVPIIDIVSSGRATDSRIS